MKTLAVVLVVLGACGVVSAAASAAPTRCGPYLILGGKVSAMTVTDTSCTTGKAIVKRLYRGHNQGVRADRGVLVSGWVCYSGTGLTACNKGKARIRARYTLA